MVVMNKELLEQVNSKLNENKNIFSRGDFDDWEISDEEFCQIVQKSQPLPIGHITEHPNGTMSQKQPDGTWTLLPYRVEDLADKKTGNIKTDIENGRNILERMNMAMKAPVIKKINPIHVPNGNKTYLENFLKPQLDKIENEIKSGNLRCRANGKTVTEFLRTHPYMNKKGIRKGDDLQNHAGYLPFVIPLIKKYGITDVSRNRPDGKGSTYTEVIGRADIINPKSGKKERVGISVVLVTLGKKTSLLKDISVFKIVDKFSLIKSLQHNSMDVSIMPFGVDRSALLNSHAKQTIPQSKKMSTNSVRPDYNGANMLNKSFDIEISDITEANREKKAEQTQKALNAIYVRQPFAIRHVKAESGEKVFDNLVLRISSFDKSKIEKAVHAMAFSLDTKIKSAGSGEAFNYKAQEELTDRFVNELTEKTKNLYSLLVLWLGLPEIRILSKSNLTYKGKILYNPENGEPIKQSEWKKFIKKVEDFLNKNYSSTGERIVLSAEALGRILERLSKTNSLEAIKKMHLENLSLGHKKFDWISDNVKNMKDVFGNAFTDRKQLARIQVAIDSAAQRVTRVTDEVKNDIQQVVIDGIKNRQSKAKISQTLFEKCVGLNRDFQKIADTEIQNNTNEAYIKEEVYNTNESEKVYFKRFELSDDNTCKKCRAIKGKIALFSKTPLESEKIKDPYADFSIWEGKTDGVMPMGTIHPYCRGGWYRYYPETEKYRKD